MNPGLKSFRALAWSLIKGWIHLRFPQVQSISTQDLAAWLASDLPPPILIDVRQREEYTLSHLPGARHLPTVAAIQQAALAADTPLVLYCSVGYRSAQLAQQFATIGYDRVMNLDGSIFEWYNRGYPVVAHQVSAQSVHPYNRIWGLLLETPQPVDPQPVDR
jgi:rhodanese-related sulfurtransferase